MDKLRVIALQLGWEGVEIEQLGCDPQTGCRDDGVIRQVGRLSPIRASVHLASYIEHDPFFGLGDAENLVVIESANSEPVTLRGRGAGRWPTGVSVMGDLLELRRLHEADSTREKLIEREFEHDYAH